MKKIRDLVSQVERDNQIGLEKAAFLSKEELDAAKALRELEHQKWEEFKEITKGQEFMRFEHFKKLNLNQNILMHLSVKNTGKTTELYRQMIECIGRGKKFIYGRVTVAELRTEIDKFATDEMSPCNLIECKGQYFFFLKSDLNEYSEKTGKTTIRFNDLIKMGYDYVGKGMTFMNSNTLGSGTYADFDIIFFDEIVSYTPKNYVNEAILSNGSVAISTILRNKKDLTVIMMGNLRNNMKEVPILKYYGIDISDNLRIIKRSMDGGEPCTILYVNSGSIYGNSIRSQASVAHHAPLEDRLFLAHNKLINTSTKVLTHEIVNEFEPVLAIALTFKQIPYILELRRHTEQQDLGGDVTEPHTIYALKVHTISLTTALDVPIITNDGSISQQFAFIKHMRNINGFRFIFQQFKGKNLYYDSAWSLDMASNIINYYVKKILKDV